MAINDLGTSRKTKDEMGQVVSDLMESCKGTRRGFERRWYDNNFFDDGFHFRYLSRQTNKIVDLSERANLYYPMRSLPKASKQVRGLANLLVSPKFVPVIYPERVDSKGFADEQTYQQAKQIAKDIAKRQGQWIESEWKEQELFDKLTLMVILSLKHSVSFMKIWADPDSEGINTAVRDAFDCFVLGNLTNIYDSPVFIETHARLLSEIKNDTTFPEEVRMKLTADNRQAASDIKDAYERARFGMRTGNENTVTLIQKEAFIKERLDKNNKDRIDLQEDGAKVLRGKNIGDYVMRQVITAANITLSDKYVNLKEFPYVDFRMEPGPIYQTSQIERFIPQNKSLDLVVSRVERYTHTMVTGAWIKRQGEQIEFTNQAGGQVLEYQTTPPVQAQIAPLPAFVFNFINLLSNLIDEQGVSLSTLGRLPQGVKGHQAIESLKESEYSNLVIASSRLKQTIKHITERMLDIADEYFITPKEIALLEKDEPTYFDIIGSSALAGRKKLKVETPENVIPIKGDSHVEIEVESGLGYTKEGQKASAKELADYMMQLAQMGYLPQEAVKSFIENLLETYQYGNLREFMEYMDKSEVIGGLSPKQIDAMKVAVMEVFKDLIQNKVLPDQETRIQESKIAMAEVVQDTGLNKPQAPQQPKGPSESISFKDLPIDGKVQMAQQAGIQLDPQQLEMQQQQDQMTKVVQSKAQGEKL